MADETALLKAARRLDQKALAAIFDLYAPAIYRYALRLCQDPVEADNVVGEVFARLLDQLAGGKGPHTKLRPYLYQIAYHVIVDNSRDMRQIVPLETAMNDQDGGLSTAGEVEDRALLDAVISSIKFDLTLDQRHVIILRFIEGFDPQETANILGKSVDNVKVIQTRAIAKLRQVLNQRSDEEW
ncbi:MAG: sigma-70 family RNA polymerase sigma factor [Chloroflexi bacterium]|nr:sigma-70 family RNA polymerase sigma factor [Chloroflexota bacterium]